MVLGLRSNQRQSPSVQVNYLVYVQDIKPWPPSQSLRSLRSAVLQWENGGRSSGSIGPVVPSLEDGKIKFNESFRLFLILTREISIKSGTSDTFQKNCLVFNLYEPRRDQKVKGQLLGTATIDLAGYGVIKEVATLSAPLNCQRSFRNATQPILFFKVQPVLKGRSSSSLGTNLPIKEAVVKNDGESVSSLMNEDYTPEAETASLTDDDASSHSSMVAFSCTVKSNGCILTQHEENGSDMGKDNTAIGINGENSSALKLGSTKSNLISENPPNENVKEISSCPSSLDLSSDVGRPVDADGHISLSSYPDELVIHSAPSSSSSVEGAEEESNTSMRRIDYEDSGQKVERFSDATADSKEALVGEKLGFGYSVESQDDMKQEGKAENRHMEATTTNSVHYGLTEDKVGKSHHENGQRTQILDEHKLYIQDEETGRFSRDSFSRLNIGAKGSFNDRLKHVKSVRSPLDSARSNGLIYNNQMIVEEKVKEAGVVQSFLSNERKDAKVHLKDSKSCLLESRIQQLESRIEMLEGELRDAAGIEAGLYAVIAEHGTSTNKVHAPARRLSRLYFHASKGSESRKANVARNAVAGLVLVAKACGNDVPRLTFWLSNAVVLRAIITQAHAERDGGGKRRTKKSSPLKWKESSPSKKENRTLSCETFDDWEDIKTFTSALERIECWIFSRIIESVWWQTLAPHMQSDGSRTDERLCILSEQDLGTFSLELWKKAFKDACERICPVRAGGHECGCLTMLIKLIMEQCVARLDVAMFNAILRQSATETPTDPVSDPISDPTVLPIPAGKSSFGSGAQLKNTIGNWSRWLSDLFGMDETHLVEDENVEDDDGRRNYHASVKSFCFLDALSDLMMLPKDMLLTNSIRKEVCPAFGAPLIKRVLDNFVPDEFCPDPVPDVVCEALDAEVNSKDHLESGNESVTSLPCIAAPIMYSPPSAASLQGTIGELGNQFKLRRSGSSLLKKSHTSDDELNDLDSPLTSILGNDFQDSSTPTKPNRVWKENGTRNAVRYQLLREVWTSSE